MDSHQNLVTFVQHIILGSHVTAEFTDPYGENNYILNKEQCYDRLNTLRRKGQDTQDAQEQMREALEKWP